MRDPSAQRSAFASMMRNAHTMTAELKPVVYTLIKQEWACRAAYRSLDHIKHSHALATSSLDKTVTPLITEFSEFVPKYAVHTHRCRTRACKRGEERGRGEGGGVQSRRAVFCFIAGSCVCFPSLSMCMQLGEVQEALAGHNGPAVLSWIQRSRR